MPLSDVMVYLCNNKLIVYEKAVACIGIVVSSLHYSA